LSGNWRIGPQEIRVAAPRANGRRRRYTLLELPSRGVFFSQRKGKELFKYSNFFQGSKISDHLCNPK
jgi:hypothetical protein